MSGASTIEARQLLPLADAGASFLALNVDQYHQLIRTGVIPEGASVELLDGMLVVNDRSRSGDNPMTVFPPHAKAVHKVGRLSARFEALGFYVRTQSPITLGTNQEPEPDAAIVRGSFEDYSTQHPAAQNVVCVIEVSESSIRQDRTTKLRLYASVGISTYLIVNLVESVVEQFTEPDSSNMRYRQQRILTSSESIQLMLDNGQRVNVQVSELLP